MNRNKVPHDLEKLENISPTIFKDINNSLDDLSFLETHIEQIYENKLNEQDELIKKKVENIASKLSGDEIKIAKVTRKIADIDGYRFNVKENVGVLISRQKTKDVFIFVSYDDSLSGAMSFTKKT